MLYNAICGTFAASVLICGKHRYIETSAKTGHNVNSVFEKTAAVLATSKVAEKEVPELFDVKLEEVVEDEDKNDDGCMC